MVSKDRPYVLYVAEVIYSEISRIKKEDRNISNEDAIEKFLGSKIYKDIGSGRFHDKWFKDLENSNFIDKKSKKKIPEETIQLLKIQKEMMMNQLIQFPKLYYTKSKIPVEISKRPFNHLWRICENYELWCKESGQYDLISLGVID